MIERLRADARGGAGGRSALFVGVVVAAGLFLILYPWYAGTPQLRAGSVAPYTLTTPQELSFESAVLTEEARAAAAAAVPERVHFDPAVRDRELAELAAQFAAVEEARADETLSASARETAIRDIPGVVLTQRAAAALATADAEEWALLVAEATEALSRTLTASISVDEIETARQRATDLLSSVLTSDQQVALEQLLRPLVVPTLIVDEDLTAADRAEARGKQPPVRVTRQAGSVLVREGAVIDAATEEVLGVAGLLPGELAPEEVAAAAVLAILGGAAAGGYLRVVRPAALGGARRLLLFILLLLVPALLVKFALAAALPDVDRHFLVYALPVAAAPMAAAVLLDVAVALLVSVLLAMIALYVSVEVPHADAVGSGQLETARLTLTIVAGSVAGVYVAAQAVRLGGYLVAGLAAAAAVFAAAAAFWLVDPQAEPVDLAWLAGMSLGNGVLAALVAVGSFVLLSRPFGIITRVELMELAQLSHPLLRRLQDEAPGTFQHSLLVGTLAERAADRIGADPLLARIGAYYHDIGKLAAPGFFVENFREGENPHDALDPLQSTRVLHQHVAAGVDLARAHGLPQAVVRFIPEHHGTRLTAFFYRRAHEIDPEIDPGLFRYGGPTPRSRETALVMLADSCEATVRSLSDRSGARIRETIDEIIKERIDEGQFDYCPITLADLRQVAEAFEGTLNAVYHPRVEYPEPTDRELKARGRSRPAPPREAPADAQVRGEDAPQDGAGGAVGPGAFGEGDAAGEPAFAPRTARPPLLPPADPGEDEPLHPELTEDAN